MPHAWNYVGAGYGVATVALASYATFVFRRTRRLRRVLGAGSEVDRANGNARG